jgi:hypothetical protein
MTKIKPNPDLFEFAAKQETPRKPPPLGRVYLRGHRLYAAQKRVVDPQPVVTDVDFNDPIGF